MKKVILLLIAVSLLSACSKSKDEPNSNSKISPPAWIQGEWLLDRATVSSSFKFTSDDFCTGIINTYSCNKETLNSLSSAGSFTNVSEEISDTNYTLTMTFSNQTVTYQFKKLSATKIQWLSSSNATYTKK